MHFIFIQHLITPPPDILQLEQLKQTMTPITLCIRCAVIFLLSLFMWFVDESYGHRFDGGMCGTIFLILRSTKEVILVGNGQATYRLAHILS